MNKEQIILDAYRNYCVQQARKLISGGTYQEFINNIKTDDDFAKTWGLKIEERELSLEEREELYRAHCRKHFWALKLNQTNEVHYERANIPVKQITLEYNNEKIEIYE